MIGIYKIESKCKHGRCYIGSTINFKKRKLEHFNNLKAGRHINVKLQNHYNKYGKSDLVFSVVINCRKEELIQYEQFFIDAYNPYFNICKKAYSKLGVKCSDETRKKISRANKGNNNWLGRKHTDETKKKLSEKAKIRPLPEALIKMQINPLKGTENPRFGVTLSKETRKKISESKKGHPSTFKGKSLSEEAKKKISIANKGRKFSDEVKLKMSLSKIGNKNALGNKLSDETRRKMSESHKGKPKSEEHKLNMRKAALKNIQERKIRNSGPLNPNYKHGRYVKNIIKDGNINEYNPLKKIA